MAYDNYSDSYNPYDPAPPSAPNTPGASSPNNPWTADELSQAKQFGSDWMSQHGIPNSWGTVDDYLNQYQGLRAQGRSHDDARQGAIDALGWGSNNAPGDQQSPQPTAPVGGGGGSSTPSGGGLLAPFTGTFTPPTPTSGVPSYIPATPNYTAPTFTPPAYTPPPAFSYEDFKAPSAQDALSDPGYQFRLSEGERALEHSAAAKGTLNTGGTLKDILNYGQNAASQEYQGAYNRGLGTYQTNRTNAVDTYNTNYQTNFLDPYKFAYQGAMDAFAPQMAQFQANVGAGQTAYSTQAAAGQRDSEMNWNHAWDQYLQTWGQFKDQRDSTFNKMFQYATA